MDFTCPLRRLNLLIQGEQQANTRQFLGLVKPSKPSGDMSDSELFDWVISLQESVSANLQHLPENPDLAHESKE